MRTFKFNYLNNDYYVTGGSFFDIVKEEGDDLFKVNLLAEYNLPCDLRIPIVDFSVPQDIGLFRKQIELVANQILSGKHVMMGCFAGRGRTGLALSCLMKYFGQENPVCFVREFYNSHACETNEQIEFVNNF